MRDVEELLALPVVPRVPHHGGREGTRVFPPGLHGADADVAGNPPPLAVQLVDRLLGIV